MYRNVGKRIFDIFVSGIFLLIFSPVVDVISLCILLDDGAPVLFRQERMGRDREPFTILKFRSMPVDTPNLPSAEAKELKTTHVGAIIRRFTIDELPQFINIIKGDLSIVGPRSALKKQESLCKMRAEKGIFDYRPGFIGLAVINSYDGIPDEEKVAWNVQYCDNASLLEDILIFFLSFIYLLEPLPSY